MRRSPKESLRRITSFFQKRARYLGVLVFLLGIFFYNQKIVPHVEVSRLMTDEKDSTEAIEDGLVPEKEALMGDVVKKYENAFQSLPGDRYRLKISLRVEQPQNIRIYMVDDFQREVQLGEMSVTPSAEFQSQEILFSTTGRYDTILLKIEKKDGDIWQNRNVFVDVFELTRLSVGVKGVAPTLTNVAKLPQANIEDLGEVYRYNFSLQGNIVDFQTLYEVSNTIRFDQEKGLLIGDKQKGEYFTYKVDMLHPFQEALIQAEQFGNAPKQLLLEYSLDNTSWRVVPYTQAEDRPQIFSGILNGDGSNILYVRSSYDAEEKRSGFFALKSLSIKAILKKSQ